MNKILEKIKTIFDKDKLPHGYGEYSINLEKIIKKLKRKYKNKKIVIYGAGLYATEVLQKYDLSGLNIVAVTDMKYPIGLNEHQETFQGYKTLNPYDLFNIDFNVIFITILAAEIAEETLENMGLEHLKHFKIVRLQEKKNIFLSHKFIKFCCNNLKLDYIKRIEL